MDYFYSRQTGAFYNTVINGEGIPDEAVKITKAQYREYKAEANPPDGKELGADDNGQPAWVDPAPAAIADLLVEKVEDLNKDCAAIITAGFVSEALGGVYTYSSELEDQLNISGNVLRATDVPQACRDAEGVKEYRVHTAAQMHQVGEDFAVYKMSMLQQVDVLKKQVKAAADVDDRTALEAVLWELPA